MNRTKSKSIVNTNFDSKKIFNILKFFSKKDFKEAKLYGKGNSSNEILKILSKNSIWGTKKKYLQELNEK